MKDLKRVKGLYAIYDINMHMWTEPISFRNDVEAKRAFEKMLKDDVFAGCPVEFYYVGGYQIDASSTSTPVLSADLRRIYVNSDTVDEGEVDES